VKKKLNRLDWRVLSAPLFGFHIYTARENPKILAITWVTDFLALVDGGRCCCQRDWSVTAKLLAMKPVAL